MASSFHRIVESHLHLCLYYTRLASDFACCLCVHIRTCVGKKKDDDATDDDETDDEAGSQAAAKAASGGNKSSSKTKMVRHDMEKGDTFIVKSLSFPNEEEAADGDSHLVCATAFSSLPTIRVGLGPTDAGSNFPKVVLEITRVPMNLCITRV